MGISDGSGLLFPNTKGGLLHGTSLMRLLEGMEGATVHGFRSSFRDWCAEEGKDPLTAETALAHTRGGVEGAYLRTRMFAERRQLMQEWSVYVSE